MKTKKLLITGASGFIGTHLVPFLKQTYEIDTVSLKRYSVADLDFSTVDTVIHLAGLAHQMKGAPDEEYFKINTTLTIELAKKAKSDNVNHFIFISTAHVYGEYGDLKNHSKRFTETSTCKPIDAYGRSKFQAEKELSALCDETFHISIIRPPMVYGEGAKGNLVNLYKLIKYSPILPFAFRQNNRSIIYIGNLIYFIELVVQKRQPGIFLPQDDQPVSINALTMLICQAMNKKCIYFGPTNYGLKIIAKICQNTAKKLFGSLAFDSKKTNEILDYNPPFSTKNGIQKMINSFIK